MPVVLGIEGTAWNLGVAIVDDEDVIVERADAYLPVSGGIHPRDAAQHHADSIVGLLRQVLTFALEKGLKIDAVSFSQGPGLGPCLRTVATAARAIALNFNIPLIGVNHCIAHVEVGIWKTGASDPITLYVSGANSQVLSYNLGRYRVLGETLDIGVGNAFDKFARSIGLPHPGGPRIEEHARGGERYIELPYTVKGMDFSFTGLTTAAREAYERGVSLSDLCHSFQETAFAMLVEVTERAVAHAGKEEVLLAGGVGANRRLQEMLGIMCDERGVGFYVPETRFLGDNAVMIAHLGNLQLKARDVTPLEESGVNPSFRPDEVRVTWK